MIFFGHEVSDTGCEILVKVGSRFADPKNAGHLTSWRDGQIIEITPLGFHNGKQVGYCCTLLKFPNIDYKTIGGRWQDEWKKMPAVPTLWDKINHTVNADGKYSWEVLKGTEFESVRKTRDYFLDFKDLENKGLLTKSEKENVYDYDNKTIITVSPTFNLESLIKHEDVDTRLDATKLLQHASITSGTHSIGDGVDYDYATITAFEAAIGAQLTGNLTGGHNAEETAISTVVTFDTDTNTYLLKLTAQSGDEHNGGAYGNGARINCASADYLSFDETTADHLADVEVSNLAIDASGSNNRGIYHIDAGSGSFLVNRVLVKGDSSSKNLCRSDQTADWRNNIIYGASGATRAGLTLNGTGTAYNNTVCKCTEGFSFGISGLIAKNNLAQGNTTDYSSSANTTAKNISEDATSPDVAYRSKDLHTNSVFKNYASDDFRLDSAGDATNLAIVDDGDDLSGTFTDDIEGQTRSTWYIGASEIVAAATQTITTSLDALVQETISKTLSIDALLQKSIPITLSIDAILAALQTISSNLDAQLFKAYTKTLSLDGLLQRLGVTTSISLDALLSKAGTQNVSLDAILYALGGDAITVSIDALLNKSNVVSQLNIDALLLKSADEALVIDALLLKTITNSLVFDAYLQKQSIGTLALDAHISKLETLSTGMDAILLGGGTFVDASLDALLQKLQIQTASLDAMLYSGQILTASLDAIVKGTLTATVDFDALLQKEGQVSTLMDAIIYSALAVATPKYDFISSLIKPDFISGLVKPDFICSLVKPDFIYSA